MERKLTIDRSERLKESQQKIRPPFHLDPSLCLYSPQTNREALEHPRVAEWLEFVTTEWQPPAAPGPRIALLLPCTMFKPYSTSNEHLAINSALIDQGWEPVGESMVPAELADLMNLERPELLHEGPLRRDGVWLDRVVISEPLALVPYEFLYSWRGQPTISTSYDDPGLFEFRGSSVTPERDDCTATLQSDGTWKWGPNENGAYAEVHNHLAEVIARVLTRVRPRYQAIGAWVSQQLTHRTFLAGRALRSAEGMNESMAGPDGPIPLRGALDLGCPSIDILPTAGEFALARSHLGERLMAEGRPHHRSAIEETFLTGDGNDTPLGLAETLVYLTAWVDRQAERIKQ